jgi:hypothetical protein
MVPLVTILQTHILSNIVALYLLFGYYFDRTTVMK